MPYHTKVFIFLLSCGVIAPSTSKSKVATTTCLLTKEQTKHLRITSDSSGVMTSPNWPDTYRSINSQCRVVLDMCDGCYVDFGFETLPLLGCPSSLENVTASELKRSCGEDMGCSYLLIQDGSKEAEIFSGDLSGHVHVPRSNKVTFLFCSSRSNRQGWKISYQVRKTGVPKSCYYSLKLRHTCPEGSCTDSLNDCAVKNSLYPKPHPGVPDEVIVGVIATLTFCVIGVIIGVLASGCIRRTVKYCKYRAHSHVFIIDSNIETYSDYDSDIESEDSDELNSQGRDTLQAMCRKDMPAYANRSALTKLDCSAF